MSIEIHTKKMYNKFGEKYHSSRLEQRPERLFNEFLELPCMIKAVGKINRKNLLDIGCGAGAHTKKYLKKNAVVTGVDISETMIKLAKSNCQNANFVVASITQLPFKSESFDIATASLVIDYVKNLSKAFKEVNRVLKKGSFLYSDQSCISGAREIVEDKNYIYSIIGYIKDKKTKKNFSFGNCWKSYIRKVELVPGMIVKQCVRPFREHLLSIRSTGFELIDVIDCKPVPAFRRKDPESFKVYTKFPLFSIFVCKKN